MSILSKLRESRPEGATTYLYWEMRRQVGWIAIFLPLVIGLGYIRFGGQPVFLDSISESYYTVMHDLFVGMLCMVGFFLIAYRGYNDWEDRTFSACAFLAFLIALCPMNPHPAVPPEPGDQCQVSSSPGCVSTVALALKAPPGGNVDTFEIFFNQRRMLAHAHWVGWVHLGSAGLLFFTLGFISFCLFTLGEEKPTDEKRLRNHLYRACGVIIWLAMAVYGVSGLAGHELNLFFIETVCLEAFGLSWLVKGDGLPFLRDARKAAPQPGIAGSSAS